MAVHANQVRLIDWKEKTRKVRNIQIPIYIPRATGLPLCIPPKHCTTQYYKSNENKYFIKKIINCRKLAIAFNNLITFQDNHPKW